MNLAIIQNELNEFYQRWKAKGDGYDSGSLADYFDRFFTLFVIYNRIYNVVTAILAKQGELDILKKHRRVFENRRTKRLFENYEATTCVAHFLREELNEIITENQSQIDEFIFIIKERLFNIDLKNGKPQKNKDFELKNGLESDEAEIIVESLLIILYKMRCNVFHAEKGFNNSQIRILEPANICLNNLVERLIVKMMAV